MSRDYSLIFENDHYVSLSGTFRFQTPEEYKLYFEEMNAKLSNATEEFVINLKEAKFMNSSGISSLGKMLIVGRSLNKKIKLLANQEIPWQAKGLKSFEKLSPLITVIIE